jgi:hypothetical protein
MVDPRQHVVGHVNAGANGHGRDRQHRDGEQPGNARDGVVDARSGSRLVLDTAARTAAVSGATVIISPMPKTTTAGRTASRYDAPGVMRAINAKPAAAISGPIVMGSRGPVRSAMAPAHGEPISMMTVVGNVARPAANAE